MIKIFLRCYDIGFTNFFRPMRGGSAYHNLQGHRRRQCDNYNFGIENQTNAKRQLFIKQQVLLGRNKSTISRELKRNSGEYLPIKAQAHYRKRQKDLVVISYLTSPNYSSS